MSRWTSRALAVTIVAVVLADWMSKFWITNRIDLGETVALIDGWLYFVHRRNPGVAFSMFADISADWRVPVLTIVSLIGIGLFAHIMRTTPDRISKIAAGIVLAGAVGNLGDRVVNGHVTDFVLVRFFPFVFNFADAAITVGGVLLAFRLARFDDALEGAGEPAPDPS